MSASRLQPEKPWQPTLLDIAQTFATEARRCWEPLWPGWKRWGGHPEPDRLPASYDTCIISSLALRAVLARGIPEFRWVVVGGRPTRKFPTGGFCDARGIAHPHMWVRGYSNFEAMERGRKRALPMGTRIIADITADQFGAEPVKVIEGVTRFYTENYTESFVKHAGGTEAPHIALWLAAFDAAMKDASNAG